MKIVAETYLVDAVSFTDAEARLYRSLSTAIPDFLILSVTKTAFKEIFNYEDCETWYKCKVVYQDVDQSSGKEKRFSSLMLVAAQNCRQAIERIEEQLSTWVVPYEITDVNLTSIVEVIPYISEEEEMIMSGRLKSVQKPSSSQTTLSEESTLQAPVGEQEQPASSSPAT